MFARVNAALLARLAAHKARDEGQTMAEYGLLLAVIALIVVAAATLLGAQIDALFDKVTAKMV